MEIKTIGVIGAGTMGIGVTVDLALHGLSAILIDINEAQLVKAREEITKNVRFAPMLNKNIEKVDVDAAMAKIEFSTDLNLLARADFIVENVTEKWEIKEQVYQAIDTICRPEVIFGANTSCTSITKIGAATRRPDKVVGMHFMNPVFMKPTVESVRGFYTSEETLATMQQFLDMLKKKAVIVNDYPGFVANRVSHLMMNEAAFLVQDQVATPAQVDRIFRECYGHKMGPLETADLIGLDTVMDSLEVLYQSYQDPKFRCCPLLKKMVEAGLLGRKSGKGFYEYKG